MCAHTHTHAENRNETVWEEVLQREKEEGIKDSKREGNA